MIKTVIKHDGTREDWQGVKFSRWNEWAARDLGIDWPTIMLDVVNDCPSTITSQDLQLKAVRHIVRGGTWNHYLMAGAMYAPYLHKKVFNGQLPTLKEQHAKMLGLNYMVKLKYSDSEYTAIEQLIDHSRDHGYPQFRLDYIYKKYALQNRVTGAIYETPQYVYMRMAMALAEAMPAHRRLNDVKHWYDHFSKGRINAPSPNFINLGTPLNGYASCCIYTSDDTARSIGVGLHIAYTMTYMSAGIGTHLRTRSLGDEVRGGMIEHQGKLPYLRATKEMVSANLQNGRGGADTSSWSAYDPENEVLVGLQNPMSVDTRKIRGIDYSMGVSLHLAKLAQKKEKMFRFNCKTAPDLYQALYGEDPTLFEELYTKYEQDPLFVKDWFSAREIVLLALNEAYETGRYYLHWTDMMNHHTPFEDTIWASNLCQEIMLPQTAHQHIMDLYSEIGVGYVKATVVRAHTLAETIVMPYSHGVTVDRASKYVEGARYTVATAHTLQPDEIFEYNGVEYTMISIDEVKEEPEVAMCNIGGIVPAECHTDEIYASAAYYALLMVDICIHKADYELPQIGFTSKARLNAGIGIMGQAYHMAKHGMRYDTEEGKNFIHLMHETHFYHLITQSIKLGEERGNAPWIHRTKWPQGYLPLDTYKKEVDSVHSQPLTRDWDAVRAKLIANKGMRFSCVVAHMPGESSSKASGQPNSLYPIRELAHGKTDNKIKSDWAAPESNRLAEFYQSAWDIDWVHQVDNYAIAQKWTDQGISGDHWRRIGPGETVSSTEMLKQFFYMTKMGYKSRYYQNTATSKMKKLDDGTEVMVFELNTDSEVKADCGAGGCAM